MFMVVSSPQLLYLFETKYILMKVWIFVGFLLDVKKTAFQLLEGRDL